MWVILNCSTRPNTIVIDNYLYQSLIPYTSLCKLWRTTSPKVLVFGTYCSSGCHYVDPIILLFLSGIFRCVVNWSWYDCPLYLQIPLFCFSLSLLRKKTLFLFGWPFLIMYHDISLRHKDKHMECHRLDPLNLPKRRPFP